MRCLLTHSPNRSKWANRAPSIPNHYDANRFWNHPIRPIPFFTRHWWTKFWIFFGQKPEFKTFTCHHLYSNKIRLISWFSVLIHVLTPLNVPCSIYSLSRASLYVHLLTSERLESKNPLSTFVVLGSSWLTGWSDQVFAFVVSLLKIFLECFMSIYFILLFI